MLPHAQTLPFKAPSHFSPIYLNHLNRKREGRREGKKRGKGRERKREGVCERESRIAGKASLVSSPSPPLTDLV